MAVLKHTSPRAEPVAPSPLPADDGAVGQHQPARRRRIRPSLGDVLAHVDGRSIGPAPLLGERRARVNAGLRHATGGHT